MVIYFSLLTLAQCFNEVKLCYLTEQQYLKNT